MNYSSTEARNGTATAVSQESTNKSRTESKSKTKTESGSRGVVAVANPGLDSNNDEPATKTRTQTKTESKSKSESASRVELVGRFAPMRATQSGSKTASASKEETGGLATAKSGSKTASASKEEIGGLATKSGSKTASVSKEETGGLATKSGSKTASASKEETGGLATKSGSKTASVSKEETGGLATKSGSKTASVSKEETGGNAPNAVATKESSSKSKTEAISRRDSLVNRLESSPVESSNNVQTVGPKSEHSGSKVERQSSLELGCDPESSHNQESPVQKENKQEEVDKSESAEKESVGSNNKSPDQKAPKARSTLCSMNVDESNLNVLPTKNNALYNTTAVLEKLDRHPSLKMRRDGKYYLKTKDSVIEAHPKVKRNKLGDVVPTIKKETLGSVERIVSRFCEDVLCISRAQFIPLSSQGERHLIWVGKKKANHIIRYLNGNGCYVVNRFPGDIFMKDKQVMGIILRDHMLMRSNSCYWKCGMPKEDILNPKKPDENEEENPLTYRICRHMVNTMHTDEEGCSDKGCYNFEKHTCKHLEIFIPEVQSFCTYNALQDFSNRLEDDLKGQTFVCKPAYLYKGYGFRFFRTSAEFQEFYHMTEGKETSRHDFMVQRLVDKPYLFKEKKVDIRAFLLVVVLRYRRVISFIHYGFCRVAGSELEIPEEEDENEAVEEPLTDVEMEKKKAASYDNDMRMFVCTHRTAQEKRERARLMEAQTMLDEDSDRSQELEVVFSKEEELQQVKEQVKHIGIRVSQAIENKVWDAFGCFQIFGMDLCVDKDMKVWLLEVNSHAMSDVDTLSPTQRKVVPAVIMEALGLVVETTYKSFHHMRLRKSPTNEFEETGFLFRQNYDFIFSTLAKKRKDYVWPKPPKKRDLPFYERIGQVDEQIKNVERRKKACMTMKIAVREEQLALKRKRHAKDDEES